MELLELLHSTQESGGRSRRRTDAGRLGLVCVRWAGGPLRLSVTFNQVLDRELNRKTTDSCESHGDSHRSLRGVRPRVLEPLVLLSVLYY